MQSHLRVRFISLEESVSLRFQTAKNTFIRKAAGYLRLCNLPGCKFEAVLAACWRFITAGLQTSRPITQQKQAHMERCGTLREVVGTISMFADMKSGTFISLPGAKGCLRGRRG